MRDLHLELVQLHRLHTIQCTCLLEPRFSIVLIFEEPVEAGKEAGFQLHYLNVVPGQSPWFKCLGVVEIQNLQLAIDYIL